VVEDGGKTVRGQMRVGGNILRPAMRGRRLGMCRSRLVEPDGVVRTGGCAAERRGSRSRAERGNED